jgi:hypothetical protein
VVRVGSTFCLERAESSAVPPWNTKKTMVDLAATVEFVIQRADASGGPGANFLIHWKWSHRH